MGFNLDFLDKNIWQPAGKGFAEADRFMDREMPFDSGWGVIPAAIATYFAAPYVASSFGAAEGGAALGGAAEGTAGVGGGSLAGESALGGGGFLDGITSLFGGGSSSGGFGLNPALSGNASLAGEGLGGTSSFGSLNPALSSGASYNGFGTTTGGYFGSLDPSLPAGGASQMGNLSGLYDLSPSGGGSISPEMRNSLGKALMNSGNQQSQQKQPYDTMNKPVERQSSFIPTPPVHQTQEKGSDIAKLVAALRQKEKMQGA